MTKADVSAIPSAATVCVRAHRHVVVRWRVTFARAAALGTALLLAAGCATKGLPTDYPRTVSTAFDQPESTRLGKLFGAAAAQYPDKSGFAIIRYGRPAFTARVALTELAEKSLDLQYYIWEADATGRILAERLVRAADRGVRVRLLLDDINLAGRDAAVAAMDAHPNIEIQLFNPFANRERRGGEMVTDLDRINHRMHNKIMVADNALAIVGGRNIGNHYFDVATDANFRDLDVVAAGPVVRDVSSVFDYFWNGEWSVPIAALVERSYTEVDLQAVLATTRAKIAEESYPHPLDQDVAGLTAELASIRDEFIWAPGRIIWDDPASIKAGAAQGEIWQTLMNRVERLHDEMLIESAYFVITEPGVENARGLIEKGVRIRVLTNSLASNDVVAAHGGYTKTRDDLLAAGVEIYELRPDAGTVKKAPGKGDPKAALHTKAVVFDREAVFIGSYNLDPRSASLNTEAGLYVESPELAAQVVAFMDEGVRPENSYRVILDEDRKLVWVTVTDGQEVRYDNEPETTFGQRFSSGVIKILPVESQL